MTTPELYQRFLQHPSVQTDTRKLKDGDIFFALKGPNFNGNLFAQQALDAGAAYAVVDEPVEHANKRIIQVTDSLLALQELAKYHREQFNIPFIAITGSNGKTTTKELVYAVLSSHFITYTTQGNLNNHIGVPLTLLSVQKDAQMAVIEMGANHQKEIEGYCRYTKPTHGIITNAGKAHLEGFGGVEGVKKGKGELYDYLRAHKGTAFVYADYDYLAEMSRGISEIVRYGTVEGVVQGGVRRETTGVSEDFLCVKITDGLGKIKSINTQLVGDYNLPNILCAAAAGKYFGVPDEKIVNAIESYTPSNSRSQLVQRESNTFILDAYNANPSSMKLAIENFARMPAANKVLMLGAMMELGKESIAEHRAVVELIKQYPWKEVVLVGGDFANTHADLIFLSNSTDARKWLEEKGFTNTHFLVKGSRSMRMETILEQP